MRLLLDQNLSRRLVGALIAISPTVRTLSSVASMPRQTRTFGTSLDNADTSSSTQASSQSQATIARSEKSPDRRSSLAGIVEAAASRVLRRITEAVGRTMILEDQGNG